MERKLENVSLEITKKCNFQCEHCGNESGFNSSKQLSKKEIFLLLDELKQLKIKRLGFTGGEPFCDKNLFKYINYIREDIPEITISTNGYLLDKTKINYLKKINITNIAISLDGTKGFHDKFRCMDGAYEKAINAIKMLNEAKIQVKIRSVVTKKNREEILKLIKITNDLKIKRHEILPVCPIGRADKNLILISEEYKQFVEKVVQTTRDLDKVNIVYKISPVFGQEQLFKNVDEHLKKKSLSYKCDALKDSIEITYDGDVIPCSFVRIPIGNIKSQKLADIFYGKMPLYFMIKYIIPIKMDLVKNVKILKNVMVVAMQIGYMAMGQTKKIFIVL